MEEGRWLALRKLCLWLGGAKAKDLFGGSSGRTGAGEAATATAKEGGGGGNDVAGGGGGGGDVVGTLQEALVRSLSGSKPEAQVRDWFSARGKQAPLDSLPPFPMLCRLL